MTFRASGCGRGGGCAMARLFLAISVLALGSAVGLAGAEAEQAKPTDGSAPAVTLRTLITGTCQEVQRYAESVVGSGVIRSAAEVQRGGGGGGGCNTHRLIAYCFLSLLHPEVALHSSFCFLIFNLISRFFP